MSQRREGTSNPFFEMVDVAIVGGGMAGLAAARRLREAGLSVVLLEGRNRFGGRAHTEREPGVDVPIELGAEFIHGAPPQTLELLEASRQGFFDVSDARLRESPHGPEPRPEFLERVLGLMDQMDPSCAPDRSFVEFLDSRGEGVDPETKRMALSYVSGFHAADPAQISERALASAGVESTTDDGVGLFRPARGYSALAEALSRMAPGASMRLNSTVKEIRWDVGAVDIRAVDEFGRKLPPTLAKAAIIALPLGVLKAPPQSAASVRFDPPISEKDSCFEALRMGSALRVTLRFRERFWEGIVERPMGFLHSAEDRDFPTWWTTLPARSPLMIAWQGGPRARDLAAKGDVTVVAAAVESLANLLRVPPALVQNQLLSAHWHDWDQDPFAGGAYSYVAVGGVEAAARFADPIDSTLFFAGEATCSGPSRGTIDGAIASGERAAAQVFAALDARPWRWSGLRAAEASAIPADVDSLGALGPFPLI